MNDSSQPTMRPPAQPATSEQTMARALGAAMDQLHMSCPSLDPDMHEAVASYVISAATPVLLAPGHANMTRMANELAALRAETMDLINMLTRQRNALAAALAPFGATNEQWVRSMVETMTPRAVAPEEIRGLYDAFVHADDAMTAHYAMCPLSQLECNVLAHVATEDDGVPYGSVHGVALSGLRERGLVSWADRSTDGGNQPVTLTAAGRAAVAMRLHAKPEGV